jgi:ribonuclease R
MHKKQHQNVTQEGILQVTQKGFGFVLMPDDEPDIFVGRRQLRDAIHGDKVKVQLKKQKRTGNPRGKITGIIQRNSTRFTGTTYKSGRDFYLAISPVTPERGIKLKKNPKKPIQVNMIVTVDVLDWGTAVSPIFARVAHVIGDSKNPENDFDLIISKYDFRPQFPKKVTDFIQFMSEDTIQNEIPNRRDIRNWTTFTIDPESARDFDDAVCIQKTKNGFSLGVHIADVSFFVTPGSELDREALKRATSVYFTEGVVHMLPETLSADLCSLRPEVDRLAMTALMEIDLSGEVTAYEIFPSVIRSDKRFTYDDVQEILDGKETDPLNGKVKLLNTLAEILFKNRSKKGSIDFDIPEPVFSIAEGGIPHEIRPSERKQSHRIVEECMLIANQTVAKLIIKKSGKSKCGIYRIHDKPNTEDVSKFLDLIGRLGISVPTKGTELSSADFRAILLAVEDSPYCNLIENVALRTMSKAIYSMKNRGHFGLAFDQYTHFTSPIRRYPDLVAHRLIRRFNLQDKSYESYGHGAIQSAVERSNEAELLALQAEREYIKLKQLRWLAQKVLMC